MLSKKVISEFISTFFLLMIVVGSGIMGEKLSDGNQAIALLANAVATGAGLIFLILSLGQISGAQMNPAVSLIETFRKNLSVKEMILYIMAQISGGICGVGAANLMFGLSVFSVSQKDRSGINLVFSEFIATFGLIAVIISTLKSRPQITPFAVAAYITSAYWFTSSTSFANPAVTIGRTLSDTFAGIAPPGVFNFIIAQVCGAITAWLVFKWLLKEE